MRGLPWDNWSAEEEVQRSVEFVRRFHDEHSDRFKGCALGLSGGIDSAVSAAILTRALGPENVSSLIMPAPQSYERDEISGQAIAKALGIRSEVFPIGGILREMGVDPVESTVDGQHIDFAKQIRPLYHGQIPRNELPDVFFKYLVFPSATLRTRFLILAKHAEAIRYSRCQTLNRTEIVTFMWTPDADTGGDVAPLSHLWKTQVYRMAEVLELPVSVLTRLSGCGNHPVLISDEDQMGMPYMALDTILWLILNGVKDEEIVERTDRPKDEVARLRDIVRVAQEFYRFPKMQRDLSSVLGVR